MDQETGKLIEKLSLEKQDGKSYSKIRSELEEYGMSPEEISKLIRQVDERVLENVVKETAGDKFRQVYSGGLALAVAGLLITVLFNLGMFLQEFPALLVYSPFLAGILLMFYGRMMQRRDSTGKEKKGRDAIRKKRPYK